MKRGSASRPDQRSHAVRRCGALFLLAALTGGCQPAERSQAAYPYSTLATNNVDRDIAFYEARVKARPDSALEKTTLAQAYLGKAQRAAKYEYFGLAEKTARESLKLQPNNSQAELILASLQEARHDFKGAFEISNKIYEHDPLDLAARSMMTNSMLELGQLPAAQKTAAGLMQQWPTSSSMMLMGRCLILEGKDKEAEQLLLTALKSEQPDEKKTSARIRSLLGDMYLREGRDDEARKWLDGSLQVTRSNFPALLTLARLEGRESHWEEMEKLYTQAFAYTENPAYLTEISYAQTKQGRTDEAKASLTSAGTLLEKVLTQGQFGHGRDLARVLLMQGKAKEALAVVQKEQLQRDDWKLRQVLGDCQAALGNWPEALKNYQQAIATGIREPVLYELAARADDHLGDAAGAAKLREQAQAINPHFKPEWVEF